MEAIRLHRHIGDTLDRFAAALASIDMDGLGNLGKSMEALKRSRDHERLEDAEQEHWRSTRGLLAVFASFPSTRRKRDERASSPAFLNLLMERSVPVEECETIVGWHIPRRRLRPVLRNL